MNAKTQRVLIVRRGFAQVRHLRVICIATAATSSLGLWTISGHCVARASNGKPVLGTLEQLPDVAKEAAVQMLLIALPGASARQMRQVVELCDRTGLP